MCWIRRRWPATCHPDGGNNNHMCVTHACICVFVLFFYPLEPSRNLEARSFIFLASAHSPNIWDRSQRIRSSLIPLLLPHCGCPKSSNGKLFKEAKALCHFFSFFIYRNSVFTRPRWGSNLRLNDRAIPHYTARNLYDSSGNFTDTSKKL